MGGVDKGETDFTQSRAWMVWLFGHLGIGMPVYRRHKRRESGPLSATVGHPQLPRVCHVSCPGYLLLGPRPFMWVVTIEPLGFPGFGLTGKCWLMGEESTGLSGLAPLLARRVKSRSIVPGNNGPWKCARQGCGGLHRKPLLTFSLGEGGPGKCLKSPSSPNTVLQAVLCLG